MDGVIAVAPLLLEYLTPIKAYHLVFRTNKQWYQGCHRPYIHRAVLLARAKDILYNTPDNGASNSGLIFDPTFPINELKDFLDLSKLYAYRPYGPKDYQLKIKNHTQYKNINVERLYYQWARIFIPRVPDFSTMDIKELCPFIIQYTKYYKIPFIELPQQIKEDPILAIKYDGKNIQYIPEDQRTLELYVLAAQTGGIRWIPAEKITKQICLDAMVWNGLDIEYIPIEYRLDHDICKIALIENVRALEWITLTNKEYIRIAASTSPAYVLYYLAKEQLTPDVYQMIVGTCGGLYNLLPKEYQTYDMWLVALSNHLSAYDMCDKKFHKNNPNEIIPALITGGGLEIALGLSSFHALSNEQKHQYYLQSLRRNGCFIDILYRNNIEITNDMKDAALLSRRVNPRNFS
jgi:hypothetical protein